MTNILELQPSTGPGEKECPACRVVKPVADFGRNKRMRDRLQFYCRVCERAKNLAWKQAHPDRISQHQKKYYRKNKATCMARRARLTTARKARLVEQFKSGPCMDCGQSYPPYVMDFDHRPGTNKKFNLAGTRMVRWGLEVVMDEIAKCDLVCSNCHRIRTHKRLKGC